MRGRYGFHLHSDSVLVPVECVGHSVLNLVCENCCWFGCVVLAGFLYLHLPNRLPVKRPLVKLFNTCMSLTVYLFYQDK